MLILLQKTNSNCASYYKIIKSPIQYNIKILDSIIGYNHNERMNMARVPI